jgi:hypothetical protein
VSGALGLPPADCCRKASNPRECVLVGPSGLRVFWRELCELAPVYSSGVEPVVAVPTVKVVTTGSPVNGVAPQAAVEAVMRFG